MPKLTHDLAQIYLSDVAPPYVFWLCDGRTISNLEGLSNAMREMRDEVFNYHVNAEKNDFANWIRDIVGDKTLASAIAKLKSRGGIASKIENRITTLKGA
jgi:hypothetical protein